jgi:hypothetical protein
MEEKNSLFKKELMYLNLEEFLGLAHIMGISLKNESEDGRYIRNDFETIENLMIDKYDALAKSEKNKLLRKVRQLNSNKKR